MAVEFPLPSSTNPWRNIYLVNGGSGISAHVGRFRPDSSTSLSVPDEMREVHIDVTGGMTLMPVAPISGSRLAKVFGIYSTVCQLGHVEWIDEVTFTRSDTRGLEFKPAEPATLELPPPEPPAIEMPPRDILLSAMMEMLGGGSITLDQNDIANAMNRIMSGEQVEISVKYDPSEITIRVTKRK